ncbi:MAG: O-antigen ligase family protein [Limisphaerales bacterium]
MKFGNPIVLDRLVAPPTNLAEFLVQPWPVSWAYWLLAPVIGMALKVGWSRPRTDWLVWLPLVWLAWQLVAATQTVEARLTVVTIRHFVVCTACFYLGLLVLSRVPRSRPFWIGLFIAFLLMIWIGFDQHYGGLEATRKFFYQQPNWRRFPPEYLKKISSDRIFSTLVYPNALAGVILLVLPPLIVGLWNSCQSWKFVPRSVTVGLFAYSGLACLVWSGSKSGWLIGLVLAGVALFQLPTSRQIKLTLLTTGMLIGSAGFFLKYTSYFERGATSVVARFDYWRAALTTARKNPVFGTGPGTFSVSYKRIKAPDSEMAQLTHNDYLEQASDSGIIGFIAYSGLLFGSIITLYRNSSLNARWFQFAAWLGILGWGLQGLVEFGLYIPASSWTAFTILGWLLGVLNRDELKSTSVTRPASVSSNR